ncbi:hypothetical protein LTR60_001168 [Cryomyces antarcticus]|nr:hypothetical protein LTR60_001168 [Cryomyces antarcticus]
MFKTNSRVALKAIDKIIPDVETYQYIAWVYAFRFLRATLSLQVSSHPETLSALQHLRSISSLAESRGDRAIRVTSAALEAMAHLRAMGSDSIELAQRAIASARSYQLDPSMHQLPQITALLDCLDLACSLQQFSPEQAATKLQAMQFVMDRVNKDDRWNADGTFSIPIQTNTPSQLTASTGGIFQRNDDGEALTLCWLRRSELYTLGYFLSGVATMHRVAADVKSEKYLTEGLKCTHDNFRPQENPSTSLSHASARLSSRAVMNWYMRVHLVFVFCNRSDWPAAERALKELQEAIQTTAFDVPEPLRLLITYLRGVLYQAAGDTEAALSVFQSPSLILQAGTPKTSDSRNDLALLATLNTILIVRTGSHLNHKLASKLIAQVEPLCLSHPNKSLASALWLLRATGVSATEVAPTIIEVKQCLQRSLHAAKSVSNNQLVAYTMTLLTDRLFTKIIGEQAEKSARTMRALVGKTASSLWTCVADGMLADTLDGNSKSEEAARFRAEATRLTQELPKPLLEKYMDGQMEGS